MDTLSVFPPLSHAFIRLGITGLAANACILDLFASLLLPYYPPVSLPHGSTATARRTYRNTGSRPHHPRFFIFLSIIPRPVAFLPHVLSRPPFVCAQLFRFMA